MNTPNIPGLFVALTCLLSSASVFAETAKPSFDFDAKVGYVSDSNVGISDIDSNTGIADTAQTYAVALKVLLPITNRFSSRFVYDYSDTAYQELSQYDLGLQHIGAEAMLKSNIVDSSLAVDKFTAKLDGEDYLDLTQFSPSVSRLVNNSVYIRAAYTRGEKTYDSLPTRNSVSNAYRGDMYMLIDQMDRYISLGIQSGKDDAVDDAYDYQSLRWNTAYGHLFDIGAHGLKLKAQLTYEHRKYAVEDESSGDTRQDKRMRFRLGADWKVFEYFSLTAYAEHMNIRSNLDTAAIQKTVYGVGIAAAF